MVVWRCLIRIKKSRSKIYSDHYHRLQTTIKESTSIPIGFFLSKFRNRLTCISELIDGLAFDRFSVAGMGISVILRAYYCIPSFEFDDYIHLGPITYYFFLKMASI